MNVQEAYAHWSAQYDTNVNKTRDLEAIAFKTSLNGYTFNHCLEIGCGTGKNTVFLQTIANNIDAVDLSEEMLAVAAGKIQSAQVKFSQADITQQWDFAKAQYDLITFSLMLEHIEHLAPVFEKASKALSKGGLIYIGELHPFKQYAGSKARFETGQGEQVVTCFNHNVSEFTNAAKANGLSIVELQEWFDDADVQTLPRILTLVLKKD